MDKNNKNNGFWKGLALGYFMRPRPKKDYNHKTTLFDNILFYLIVGMLFVASIHVVILKIMGKA